MLLSLPRSAALRSTPPTVGGTAADIKAAGATLARSFAAALLVLALILPQAPAGADDKVPEPVLQVFRAIVGVQATVPAAARSAQGLGTNRGGTGVVIGEDGILLTIGYLILEADSVSVIVPGRGRFPADVVGYDHETGFGLVRARDPLGIQPVPLGDSARLAKGTPALVASIGATPLSAVYVMNRRPYAGSWEYLLDDAIYTAPVHGEFGGAALVGADGSLLGIGSLMVDVAEAGHTPFPGNVFVPINQLKPILGDLVRHGRASGRTNPWLGVYTGEQAGRVFIQRVSDGGPAERAGLRSGDIIVGVAGRRVADTESFLRQVWAGGRAGDPISLDILRPERGTLDINRVLVPSISRYDWLRLGPAR